MPVPKRKRSKARRDKRFANKGIAVKIFSECKNCNAPIPPHQVCDGCGYYKGKKILSTKIDRAIKRGKAKQEKMAKEQKRTGTVEPKVEEPKE